MHRTAFSRHYRRAQWAAVLLLVISISGLASLPARAQEGKPNSPLSWKDALAVPLHRSQADWLVEVGWKTAAEMYGPFPTHEYQVGETEQLIPLGGYGTETATFVLVYRSAHAYFWFERGVPVDHENLEYAANFFEDHIWPLNHSIYGGEWNPGIDGDSRIHIVNQSSAGPGIMGAFSPEDQCPRVICPGSNQREILYIGLDNAPLGSDQYLTTIAHEDQHLIQYYVDGNEQIWFNEGLSQLAEHLNGFNPRTIGDYNMIDFLNETDHSLNSWSTEGYDVGLYYGASYLFMVYLYEQFGLDFMRALVKSDYGGLAAVQHALDETDQGINVDQVFGRWILANNLDNPYAGDGHYYYQSLDLPNPIRPSPLNITHGGAVYSDMVNQYGADYLSVDEPGRYTLSFDGSDTASLMGAAPHSGDWMWWSNNENSSAARLTASFDLSGLKTATLVFSAWWNIEADYDWFQVLVSGDGGHSWEIVSGPRASKNGENAPGDYYSGQSNTWLDEQINLNDYTGRSVQVRIEYLTDHSQTLSGLALDDLGIVELGALDNVENPTSPWKPEGFLRVPATVPQHWALAVVVRGPDQRPTVQTVTPDTLNTGRATFTVPEGGSATLVIGAMAPFTTARATYKIALQHEP